jgi:threonine synthase
VFVPAGTSDKKLRQMRAHGATVVASGTREDAAATAIETVTRRGAFYASHVYSPFFFEGTKTYGLELIEQLGRLPDRLVLPVGNGTLVLGVVRLLDALAGAGRIDALPHLLLVQSSACAPLAAALRSGAPAMTPVVNRGTVAEGIAIAAPPRGDQLIGIVRRLGATVVAVEDAEVTEATRWLASRGFYVEPTAAAPLAGLRAAISTGIVEAMATTVLPLSGTGLKAS